MSRKSRLPNPESLLIVALVALGVGANAVVFALLNTAVLNALPYPDPERLVALVPTAAGAAAPENISPQAAYEWARRSRSFDAIESWGDGGIRLLVAGRTEMVRGMRVSGGYLDLLGARMQLGRSFSADDNTPAGSSAVILTDATWRELFDGDPGIVGRTVPGVGGTYRIVGVLSSSFHPLHMSNPGELPRMFMPQEFDLHRGACARCPDVRLLARLARGTGVGGAQAEMRAIASALAREDPEQFAADATLRVVRVRELLLGRFGDALALAQALGALFLLLACASVAALLLAQGARRRGEIALRAALGADRRRIVAQLLVEWLRLAGAGGTLGVALAWAAVTVITHVAPPEIPRLAELKPDATLLVFGVVASAATGLIFAVVPALRATRVDLHSALKAIDGTSGAGLSDRTAMNALVVAEVTLAFVLVLAVGVLGRSYARLLGVDAGFDARRVLTLSLMPDAVHYGSAERRLGYYDAVVAHVQRINGVDVAGYASTLPLSHSDARRVYVLEQPVAVDADAPLADYYLASPDYFRALQIPVRRGRAFTDADRRGGAAVAVVSETAARSIFRGVDPIGRHIQIGARDAGQPWATIVGVVGDVRQYGLDASPGPAAYLPFAQAPNVQGWASLVVRASGRADAIETAVRGALVDVDPTQPQFHVQPMEAYVSKSIAQRTFTLALVAGCGAAALLIATLGVYSVVSYVVDARRREAAIRIALGAHPSHVVYRASRWVVALTAGGVAAGLAIAAAGARTVEPLLFDGRPLEPLTIAAACAVVTAAALVAAYVPARRVARLDPLRSLREH